MYIYIFIGHDIVWNSRDFWDKDNFVCTHLEYSVTVIPVTCCKPLRVVTDSMLGTAL